jgi:putative spermidine/putrescine transport system permease protein
MRTLRVLVGLVYVFVLAPAVVVIGSAFTTTTYITFPPQGFTLDWFNQLFQLENFRGGFALSLRIAAFTTLIDIALGLLAAMALVRYRVRGRNGVRMALLVPALTPSLLIGFALLNFSIRFSVPSSFAMLMGHVLITLPLAIVIITQSLERLDQDLEYAALSLGAHELSTFRFVVFPAIRPGLTAAGTFAFLLSFDQLPISLILKDVAQGTFPVELFNYIRYEINPVLSAVSTLFIIVNLVLTVIGLLAFRRVGST